MKKKAFLRTCPARRARLIVGGWILLATSLLWTLSNSAHAVTFSSCSGGDDAAAVQNAIDSTPNGGTFTITCMANIGAQGVHLRGRSNLTLQGQNGGGFRSTAQTNLRPDFGPAIMFVEGSNSMVVQDLDFNCNNIPIVGLVLFQSDRIIVRRNRVH